MKRYAEFVTALVIVFTVIYLSQALFLFYLVFIKPVMTAQIIFLFVLMIIGFGTESKRKINSRIQNPYDNGNS